MEDKQIIIIYKSYSEAQKRANKKYRENNKDKINQQRKIKYNQKKIEDPEYLQKKKEKAREYYLKKKSLKRLDSESIINDKDIELEQMINIIL